MKCFGFLYIVFIVVVGAQLSDQNELDLFTNVDEVCRLNNAEVVEQTQSRFGFEIVGGEIADPDRFPYLVSIQSVIDVEVGKYQHVCGGTLIAPRTILTAAHCVLTAPPNGQPVQDLRKNSEDGKQGDLIPDQIYAALNPYCRHQQGKFKRVMVKQFVIHPQFEGLAQFGSDIAVLYLETEFEGFEGPFMDYQLSDEVDFGVGGEFVVVGHGATSNADLSPFRFVNTVSPLQRTSLEYVDDETCNSITTQLSPTQKILPKQMICFQDQSSDTCTGDSGGPLILAIDDDKTDGNLNSSLDTQVGITSWGPDFTCSGISGFPGVYTYVAQYINWIDSVINPPSAEPDTSPSVDISSLLAFDYASAP